MANADSPCGLRPVQYADGRPYNGATRTYYVPASDTTPLYLGDPVKLSGTGDVTGKYPAVERAAAGDAIVGVVTGVMGSEHAPLFTGTIYRPASTEAWLKVADDPNLLFEVQEDSVAGALAVTAIGQDGNLIIGTGSAITGLSGVELDSSSFAATTDVLDFKLIALSPRADNALGTNAKWLVRPNSHQYAYNINGV